MQLFQAVLQLAFKLSDTALQLGVALLGMRLLDAGRPFGEHV